MDAELERLDELEDRRSAELARAHAAVTTAQDKAYWLDRWQLDLNALMRRRGASEARAALRGLRAVYRALYNANNRMRRVTRSLPGRVGSAARVVAEERAQAVPDAALGDARSRRLRASPVSDRLTGRVDPDDARALVGLQRADALVDALARIGSEPSAGQAWLGVGAGAEAVLEVLAAAYPDLVCRANRTDSAVDVVFALSAEREHVPSLEQIAELGDAVRPGGRLLWSAVAARDEEPPTAELLLARCTPEWRVELFLKGGMEGDRDLYILERA